MRKLRQVRDSASLLKDQEAVVVAGAKQTFVPPQCSDQQVATVHKTFYTPLIHKNYPLEMSGNQRFHTPLMKSTRCPGETWIEEYFGKSKQESFLGINVGCNKGLDAIAIASLLSRNPLLSPRAWHTALKSPKRPVCGIPAGSASSQATNFSQHGKVYCIEPMPSTMQSLQRTLNATPGLYSDHIVLTNAVMSNTTGTSLFPNGISGEEGSSLGDCSGGKEKNASSANCVSVPAYRLDDFYQQEIISNAHDQDIDILLIDAEGYDYEVIQGSKETLTRVKYLTFEVNLNHNWLRHSLVELIETTLSDFTCYWAGKGKLWRITNCLGGDTDIGKALKKTYEFHSWSNVACVRTTEVGLAKIMEHTFLNKTIDGVV